MDSILLSYMIQSIICSLVFWIIYELLFRKSSSYGQQRWFLISSAILTPLLPLIKIPVFSINSITPDTIDLTIKEVVVYASNGTERVSSPNNLLFYTYFSVVIGLLFILSLQLLNLIFKIKKSSHYKRGNINYVISDNISSPFSLFSYIFLNTNSRIDPEDPIIAHEIAHVKKRHSLEILIITAINLINWFNPLIYIIKKRIAAIHEYEADREVLNSGYPINNYRELLISQQLGNIPLVANSFAKSLTIKRLKMMEKLNLKQAGKVKILTAILLCTSLFLWISCTQSSPKETSDPNSQEVPMKIAPTNENNADTSKLNASGEEIPFSVVENKPSFNGGDENNFTKWVVSELNYPPIAKEKGIQGRVILQFLVDKNGDVKDVKVVRAVDPLLDQEAVRVVSSSPKWVPGNHRGKNVNVRYTFPVIFKLR